MPATNHLKTIDVPPLLSSGELFDFFDEVYVINLRERVDRLDSFERTLKKNGWPFKPPKVWEAVPGGSGKVPCPPAFKQGGGAFGCAQSHVAILQHCLMNEVGSVLILEDDAITRNTFLADTRKFMDSVPADWEGIMLGGQHHWQPIDVGSGLVRVRYAQRTHAYACRGRYMRALYERWARANVHIDWLMKDWQEHFRVYAPTPWLIGQDRSQSGINGRTNPATFWDSRPYDAPVVLLRSKESVAQKLRDVYGWHTGYTRTNEGYDIELAAAAKLSGAERTAKVKRWLDFVRGECSQTDELLCTAWHPDITSLDLRMAGADKVLEVTAESVQHAIGQLPPSLQRGRVRISDSADHVVLLRTNRSVVEALRERGWHTGHWRDEITGRCNGLRRIFEGIAEDKLDDRAVELRGWVDCLRGEAAGFGGVIAAWHPLARAEEFQRIGETAIEVSGETVEEVLKNWEAAKTSLAE